MKRGSDIGMIIGAFGVLGAVGTAIAASRPRGKRAGASGARDASLRALEQPGLPGQLASAPLESARLAMVHPLPMLADGRRPRITSHHKARNPSRPSHDGVDWFYPVLPSDPAWERGDGGASGNGRWIVPPGTPVIAVARGRVQRAGHTSTGWRIWIAHGPLRTGYFHLSKVFVKKGEHVTAGQQIGIVGDNPAEHDARHLHFELSATARYEPIDPVPYLEQAIYLPLRQTTGPVRDVPKISAHA